VTAPAPLAALLAILAEEDPRAELARRCEWLVALLQTPPNLVRLDALVEIETGQLFEWDAERRLAALLPSDAVAVARFTARLEVPAALGDRLAGAVAEAGVRIVSWLSPREIRRAIYRIGAPAFRDRVMLGWAGSSRSATTPQWRLLLVYPETWTPPAFPLGEAEFRAAGVSPGPLTEQVRREVEEWWIDLDFTDDKMAAVERLKAVVQGLLYA
jgi:poly(A) polymerase